MEWDYVVTAFDFIHAKALAIASAVQGPDGLCISDLASQP
jgi:hypothetical protein